MKIQSVVALLVLALVAGVSQAQRGDGDPGHLNPFTQSTPGGPEVGNCIVTIDITGLPFVDGLGDPDNAVLGLDMNALCGAPGLAPASVTGLAWSTVVSSFAPSWGSEKRIAFGPAAGPAEIILTLNPGANAPGGQQNLPSQNQQWPDPFKFAGIPLNDIVLPNGFLRVELFDSFDDFPNAPDGIVNQGLLRIQANVVPEPVSLALLGAAGLSTLILRRRR